MVAQKEVAVSGMTGQPPSVDLRAYERIRGVPLSDPAHPNLTLGELAEHVDMTPRNVRAYQQRGLLPATRRDGRRLSYGWEHVSRLRLIRALHARGLSLRVIEDLVHRGVAEAELARLNEEVMAEQQQPVRVPIGEISLDVLRADNPQAVADLVEAGVVHVESGQLVASSAGLGVAGALLSHGMDLATICQIVLNSSRAAETVGTRMRTGGVGDDAETVLLALRLASITFNEALAERVGPALPDAAEVTLDDEEVSLSELLPRQS